MLKNQNNEKTQLIILELISNEPISACKIKEILDNEGIKLSRKVLYDHLNRLIQRRAISYLRKNQVNARAILQEAYNKNLTNRNKEQRYYLKTNFSEKLCKKLIHFFGRKDKLRIGDIINIFQGIEVLSKLQEVYFMKPSVYRRIWGSEGKDYSDEEEQKKVNNAKKDVNNFFKIKPTILFPYHKFNILPETKNDLSKKWDKIINFFKMDKFMHWIAYKDEFNRKNQSLVMFDKLGTLFAEKYL